MNNKISTISRILILISAVLLCISIFVPIWRIELDAPQYPEGLVMQIYANKLGGDVDIINGLNHYIGMGTLHAENFIEFTVLPYIIGVYALLFLIVAIIAKKKGLYISFGLFVLFGILAMVDFWRWEYNYGHHLDPNAAIIVPGMAYQPPLIGFKQLLNFGAFSVPDIGGYLFIASGIITLIAVTIESNLLNKIMKKNVMSILFIGLSITLMACTDCKPEAIQINKDACSFCKMTISDARYASEIITDKGRIYKFDDISCMIRYKQENYKTTYAAIYVIDFNSKNQFIKAEDAFYIHAAQVKSPMGGNNIAFATRELAISKSKEWNTTILDWNSISK